MESIFCLFVSLFLSASSGDRGKILRDRPACNCSKYLTHIGLIVPREPMGIPNTNCIETCVEDLNKGAMWNKNIKMDSKKRAQNKVIADLQHILNKSVPVDNISTIFHEVNVILHKKETIKKHGFLISLVEQLGVNVKLNESQSMAKIVDTDVALLVIDNNYKSRIWGFQIYNQNNRHFQNDSIEYLTQSPNATYNASINDVVVVLPKSVASSTVRISFLAYRSDNFSNSHFADPDFGIINSPVISITVKNLKIFQLGEITIDSYYLIITHSVHVKKLLENQFIKSQFHPNLPVLTVVSTTSFTSRGAGMHVHFKTASYLLYHVFHRKVINIYFNPIKTHMLRNESLACAYWEYNASVNNTGRWSLDGCKLTSTEPGLMVICSCNHLTHFALLLVPEVVFSKKNEEALEIISVIGCSLSILGLIIVILTAATFKTWRQEFSNKIWLNLCISILFRSICFLVIAFAKPHNNTHNFACTFLGMALHYSVLCSLCWMLVAAVIAYRKLVLVFTKDPNHKLLIACTFSYGAPCAVVFLCLILDVYAESQEKKTPSGLICYPSGASLWIAVYTPFAAILLVNWTLFSFIVHSVFVSKRVQRYGNSMDILRTVSVNCLLVILFGLPWISGIFTRDLVGAYIFNISSTFEGFILCIFFVLGNAATRNLWLKWIKSFG